LSIFETIVPVVGSKLLFLFFYPLDRNFVNSKTLRPFFKSTNINSLRVLSINTIMKLNGQTKCNQAHATSYVPWYSPLYHGTCLTQAQLLELCKYSEMKLPSVSRFSARSSFHVRAVALATASTPPRPLKWPRVWRCTGARNEATNMPKWCCNLS